METACFSETLVSIYKSTRCYEHKLNNHHSASSLQLTLKFLVYSKRGRAPHPFLDVGKFQTTPSPLRHSSSLPFSAVAGGATVARQDPLLSLHHNTKDVRQGRDDKK
jgi:hypothetical protein